MSEVINCEKIRINVLEGKSIVLVSKLHKVNEEHKKYHPIDENFYIETIQIEPGLGDVRINCPIIGCKDKSEAIKKQEELIEKLSSNKFKLIPIEYNVILEKNHE